MISLKTGHGRELWPVLLLLLVAVVVPTVCVLWFMKEAMRNERLAVRQKIEDAYRPQLDTVLSQLEKYWQDKAKALAEVDREAGAPAAFANLVSSGVCDSVIIYDSSGQLMYPAAAQMPTVEQEGDSPEWVEARRHEYEQNDPGAAAVAYRNIAGHGDDSTITARALQAQARCLAKAGQTEAAIEISTDTLADSKYRDARDANGRLIVPNAELFALQLMGDPAHPGYKKTVELLAGRLTDYSDSAMPSSQRYFLMEQLQALVPDCPPFPTLDAESLAADYLESNPQRPTVSRLILAPLPNVWQLASADKTAVALFREQRLVSAMQSLVESHISLTGASIKIMPRANYQSRPAPLLDIAAGEWLPGWHLGLYLEGPDPFAVAADKRIAAYLWTGVLVIAVIAILAVLLARYVGHQVRLTHLRNDLIATVSHELKTPLSSMRVLVDTLLEGRTGDRQQEREYLQLIAKENMRLSRLIDNFLTFSRMERNKRQAFEFAEVKVEDIVAAAQEAVSDRFKAARCQFDVDVAPNLPLIIADRDALITVALNLLDNAYKYSSDEKHIILRAYAADANVCLEVEDNGIGLSRREMKKIFDRFYQVDQSLARESGGCGLGLSIVKFIIDAHGGTIGVRSQPGKGSTFTVKLPIARNA
jgi:signal transduction histidine kinase